MKLCFLIMTELLYTDSRVGVHKTSQNQASENPGLAGESLAEDDLLAKTLRNVMGVVDAVRGGVTSLWM